MTISQDILIDTALNVAGYVAAGALWLVLSSLFQRSPRRAVDSPRQTSSRQPETEAARQDSSAGRRKPEFVDLKGFDSSAGQISRAADSALREESGNFRRNRTEVMRMAREMLEAGSSRDRVRQTLPISEGELALLTRE